MACNDFRTAIVFLWMMMHVLGKFKMLLWRAMQFLATTDVDAGS